MKRLVTAGLNEAQAIYETLEELLDKCRCPMGLRPAVIDDQEFLAMSNGSWNKDDIFGYIPINGTSGASIAESVLKVAIYGGSDRNYMSGMAMMKQFGKDYEERMEIK